MISHDSAVYDATSSGEQKETAEKVAEIAKDYAATFDTESGRRVLADLCYRCYLNATTYDADPQRTAANEGNREVVVDILKQMLWGEKPHELVDAYMAVQKAEGIFNNVRS